ncbi:TPA: radical SAM protein [Candidatus Woesearchaeota archaeon]|nr:radical SAM protein [Candidatus Woesearchaeota archaeon]HIH31938.1 radical SAM protein [Candidatus Woesearchaeota archaeon]HIH55492.1 radical SAM protein [Candidatus Woesearchaeota archaeon]HIJ01049.1 radical SAM protein [Candidatus Woesearchaeota archaeon]HIJ14726.1 radical SAM protein [Candidatus Woesearchaeota archaeon]
MSIHNPENKECELCNTIDDNVPNHAPAIEEEFLYYINKEEPMDYERQLMEKYYDRIQAVLSRKAIPPYELEIQPTSYCNLTCGHCIGRFYERLPSIMTFEDMQEINHQVQEFQVDGYKIDNIKFCGTTGEPLMNPATLDGLELFKKSGYKTILFTNGILLNSKTRDDKQYFEVIAKYTDKLNLSLDADSEDTFIRLKGRSGFGKAISGLENLLLARDESKHHVVVSYVISKYNYDGIIRIAELLKRLGPDELWYRVDFTNLQDIKELSEKIINDLDIAKGLSDKNFRVVPVYSQNSISKGSNGFDSTYMRCYNQFFWACIGPDMDLYACGHRTHSGIQSFGNLRKSNLKELWIGNKRDRCINNLPDNHCSVCSPSSTRRNEFMTFLSTLTEKQMDDLHKKYFKKESSFA